MHEQSSKPIQILVMRLYILLSIFILSSCGNSRVEKLEKENLALKNKVDSMQILADTQVKIAKEMRTLAIQKGNELMDSLIIEKNLRVIRVNESCGEDTHIKLLDSIKSLEQELVEFGIEVIYNDLDDCGYELHYGTRNKRIEGIINESDLINEIERFYKIQLKLNESLSSKSNKKSTS